MLGCTQLASDVLCHPTPADGQHQWLCVCCPPVTKWSVFSSVFCSQTHMQGTEKHFNFLSCSHLFSSPATDSGPSSLFVWKVTWQLRWTPTGGYHQAVIKWCTKQLFLWKECIVSLTCKPTATKIGFWNYNNKKLSACYLTVERAISHVLCLSPFPAASQCEGLNWQVIFFDFQSTFVCFRTTRQPLLIYASLSERESTRF